MNIDHMHINLTCMRIYGGAPQFAGRAPKERRLSESQGGTGEQRPLESQVLGLHRLLKRAGCGGGTEERLSSESREVGCSRFRKAGHQGEAGRRRAVCRGAQGARMLGAEADFSQSFLSGL